VKRERPGFRSTRGHAAVPKAARRELKRARASEFVYSSLGFYARRRGGELSGSWLVAALEEVGVAPATTRKTLWRMERDGELISRRAGRSKLYRATPLAWAEIEGGTDKILGRAAKAWDGRWTVVAYAFEAPERVTRERIRAVLDAEGFGAIGPGVFVHPRDRGGRILAAAEEQASGARLRVFRGQRLHGESDAAFVSEVWNLRESARCYRRFLEDFRPLAGRAKSLSPKAAFAVRFAVVLAYLRAAWADPELPDSLLPPDWPGQGARALAARLYRALLPAALAHGDAIARVGSGRIVPP
jgi:phenylacetic acid degradation operon negative regulatory protein